MNKFLVFAALIGVFGVAFARCADPQPLSSQMRVEITSSQLKALLAATEHLRSREDYTVEQRKPGNYSVWIDSSEKEIRVSFLAIPRPPDRESKGGNYSYARSTTYVLAPTTFEVLRVIASK
jgi:hypothetical protein